MGLGGRICGTFGFWIDLFWGVFPAVKSQKSKGIADKILAFCNLCLHIEPISGTIGVIEKGPNKYKENGMEITDIRVRKVAGEGKLKAYVTITFDECFVVHNVKIIEGKTGVFIAMPSRKTRAGEYKDVAHPIHPEFRAEMQKKILDKYDSGAVQDDESVEL